MTLRDNSRMKQSPNVCISILRVFCFEKRSPVLDQKCFERVLPVDQGGHDLSRARFRPVLEHGNVTAAYMLSDHGVADDAYKAALLIGAVWEIAARPRTW